MALQLSLWRSCDAIHQLQPRGSPQSRARLARRSQLVVHAGFNSGRWVLSDKETSKRYELVGASSEKAICRATHFQRDHLGSIFPLSALFAQ